MTKMILRTTSWDGLEVLLKKAEQKESNYQLKAIIGYSKIEMLKKERYDLAKLGMERAEDWLKSAERAFEDERWSDVVYSSQMATEQVIKAVFLALGIDYPKEHDVSDVLVDVVGKQKLPPLFQKEVPRIAEIAAELAEQRGLAGYGFEMGISREYFKDYAPEALQYAKKVFNVCKRFLKAKSKSSRV